jgi:hypothetical protein
MALPTPLQELHSQDLPIRRSDRYAGGDFSIQLSDLQADDVALLQTLYRCVREIYDVRLYMGTLPDFSILRELLRASERCAATARQLGKATYASGTINPMVQRTLHDVRAGGLSALLGYVEMMVLDDEPLTDQEVDMCVGLARDHAKMMRNGVEDLDPWIRQADERISLHSVQADFQKWQGALFPIERKAIRVECSGHCEGYVSNRCLETSSVDRILYNLINNAARFTQDERVSLQVDNLGNRLVRWVVSNSVSPDQQTWIREHDVSRLFEGGLTRGGTGVGLSNCTRLVSLSFGLGDDREALEQRYIGGCVENDRFYAWFHWPLYAPAPGDPVCDCA